MKFHIVYLLVALFLAWLVSFCLDCYWYGVACKDVGRTHRRDNNPPYPGEMSQNLFWFLQISDIHISVYIDPKRHQDLSVFIQQVVGTVRPAVVFVTGDITDAKTADQIFSVQHETEWKIYKDILNQSRSLLQSVPWIDLRGNHDAFDVPWKYHQQDMYRRYAVSSHLHSSTAFKWSYTTKYGVYSFVGVDACPSPGLRRPYNFFGVLHDEDLSVIENVMDEVSGDNLTVIISHYPSNFITADFNRLRKIFSGSVAHLSGHLHDAAHYVKKMYARHPDGHLELELSDWKYNRRFRLMAVDHDMLSFADNSLHDWPLVLITNPINAQFTVPSREPTGRMRHSTHIRILVFSPWPITSVTVSIDGGPNQTATLASKDDPLYVLPWQPDDYSHGMHSLVVVAQDSAGHVMSVSERFSLDGTQEYLTTMAKVLLLTDHRSLARMNFFFYWLLLLLVLVTAWYGNGSQRLQHLTKYPPIFYPLLLTIIYFAIGPWYVGELLNGVYGFVFAHGIVTANHYIEGSLTYFHGTVEILTFHVPLTLYLAHLLQPRPHRHSRCTVYSWNGFLALTIMYHVWGLRRTVYSYGWLTVFVSPGYVWSMLLGAVLVYVAIRKQRQRR